MKHIITTLIKIILLFQASYALSQEPVKIEKGLCGYKNITCIVNQYEEVN